MYFVRHSAANLPFPGTHLSVEADQRRLMTHIFNFLPGERKRERPSVRTAARVLPDQASRTTRISAAPVTTEAGLSEDSASEEQVASRISSSPVCYGLGFRSLHLGGQLSCLEEQPSWSWVLNSSLRNHPRIGLAVLHKAS